MISAGSGAALMFNCFPSSFSAEFSDYNSLNVPPHNRRHQVSERTIVVVYQCKFVSNCFFRSCPLLSKILMILCMF